MIKKIEHEIKALRNGGHADHDKARGIGEELKHKTCSIL